MDTPGASPLPASTPRAPSGRLRHNDLESLDRQFVMWMHLSPLLGFMVMGPFSVIIPLVMWQCRRNTSAFTDDHGRELMNVLLSGLVFLGIGLVTGIGFIFWLAWVVIAAVGSVRAAMAANNAEYFRYPMTIRFLGQS